jgi:hypothetical protein
MRLRLRTQFLVSGTAKTALRGSILTVGPASRRKAVSAIAREDVERRGARRFDWEDWHAIPADAQGGVGYFCLTHRKAKLADFTLVGRHRPLRPWNDARNLHFDKRAARASMSTGAELVVKSKLPIRLINWRVRSQRRGERLFGVTSRGINEPQACYLT